MLFHVPLIKRTCALSRFCLQLYHREAEWLHIWYSYYFNPFTQLFVEELRPKPRSPVWGRGILWDLLVPLVTAFVHSFLLMLTSCIQDLWIIWVCSFKVLGSVTSSTLAAHQWIHEDQACSLTASTYSRMYSSLSTEFLQLCNLHTTLY